VNLSDLVIVVRASTRDFEAGMARTRKEIASTQTTAQKLNNVGGAVAGVGKKMALGITLPVLAGVAYAVKVAANFETTMNQVQAAAGATKAEMADLGKYALKMGADTMFSAGEAGQAMLELAKGGMTAAQIKAGGLKAALDLAAAGGLDLATAANTTVAAMNMFNLSAKDAPAIAAALAGGANASTASVESLALALSQVGPGATNAGLSLQQTTGVLAAFANAGIQGSDAGTSLKTFLSRLVPTTKTATAAMKALDMSFVNQDGSIKSISQVAEILKTKMGGLSQAQRIAAMSAIFGSDATRAATVLMKEGATGIDKYVKATSNQNAATDMAKARTKGLAGQWEQLKGSLETIAIAVGTILIPWLTKAVKWLTKLFNKFLELNTGQRKTVLVIALVAAAIGPLLILFGKMAQGVGAIINMSKAFGSMPGGFKKFGEGLKKMFDGADLKGGAKGFTTKLKTAVENALASVKTLAPKAFTGLKSAIQSGVSKAASGLKVGVSAVASFAGSAAGTIKDTAVTIANTAAKLANAVATKVVAAAQWLWNAALTANPLGLIIVGIVALVAIFVLLWTRCAWFRNFWKALWHGIVTVVRTVWTAIKPSLDAIWKGIKVVWDKVWAAAKWVWARIGPFVLAYVRSLWAGLKFWFGVISKVLHAAWTGLVAVTRRVWPIVLAVVRHFMGQIRVAIAVIKVVVGIVRAAWTVIVTVTRTIWRAIAFAVRQGVHNIVVAVAIIHKVRDAVAKAWQKVKAVTVAIWNGIKTVVMGVINWILDQIKKVISPLQKAYNTVKGWLGSSSSAQGGRGGMGGRRFASGGYIPATTGGRTVTVGEGGEGEWVVPASKSKAFAAEMGAPRGGDTFHVNVQDLHGTDRRAAERLAADVVELVAAKMAQRRRMVASTGY
jgi:TP901 family phage tail tape measure protein